MIRLILSPQQEGVREYRTPYRTPVRGQGVLARLLTGEIATYPVFVTR
jgi:hypothetical protein